ncbi:ribonuclease HII [Phragmitibacter flavus]|uniref:Ribonuclease HII n=2 Tax=Phragmitibacter flavus TaxID=2576071 RepID=A0A5R8KC53_9BACT|nr:ribonuclease HII [Phragmitibacter flavus]
MAHERSWRERGFARVAGVDEAGRGPLAGPVHVAAVVLPDGFEHADLHDSKQLSEAARERIFEELTGRADVAWSLVVVEVLEVDRINVLQAARVGMRRAVLALQPVPEVVLVDGLEVPDFPFRQEALVKGDARSLSIAAASVIAKVSRDRYMRELAKEFPEYGFERHKGYGTAAHLAALQEHGPCVHHRISFSPVAQLTFSFDAA